MDQNTCKKLMRGPAETLVKALESHGFRLTHQQDMGDGRCFLVFESPDFRVKIYRGRGELNLQVGNLSAPPIWEESKNGQSRWHYLYGLAAYLEDDLTAEIPNIEEMEGTTLVEQAKRLQKLFNEHYEDLRRLFGENQFESERERYDRFISQKARRLEEKLRKLRG